MRMPPSRRARYLNRQLQDSMVKAILEVLWEHGKKHWTSRTVGITENFLEEVMSVLRFEGCGRKE